MAQNVTVAGASYSAVPSLDLPKTGGGTSSFYDVSDTTATASDVAQGKVFYDASGALTTGTASGGGSDDPYPVRNDGKTHLWVLVDDMAYAMVSIAFAVGKTSTGSDPTKANIDWGDGSPIENYSKTAAQGMQHSYQSTGLYEIVVSSGTASSTYLRPSTQAIMGGASGYGQKVWPNYQNGSKLVAAEFGPTPALATAENVALRYMWPSTTQSMSNCPNLEKLTVSLGNKTATGSLELSPIGARHNYSTFNGASLYSCKEVNLPDVPMTIRDSAFYRFASLKTIDLHNVTSSDASATDYCFSECSALISVTLWDAMGGVGTSMFDGCKSLRNIDLPAAVASIGESGFNDCWSLQSVTIPAAVTTVGANAFANCYSLASITFLPTTPPTVADATAWTNLPTTCEIHVPTGTLADYTAAANYPDPATYTYIED